jgi:purine-nucleoside phosphorylase
MPTVHISAAKGDIADTVLMPGDPRRAELIAERYLESPSVFNRVRGMLGVTGKWQGRPLSVLAHGLGMPSMGIYAHELVREFGVRTLVRLGTCGALQPGIRLRDLLIVQAAPTDCQRGPLYRQGTDRQNQLVPECVERVLPFNRVSTSRSA